jgi:hypothetical protein
MWGLWWTKRYWGRFLRVLRFPLSIISPNSPSSWPPGAGTIGLLWPQGRVDPIGLHPPLYQLKKKIKETLPVDGTASSSFSVVSYRHFHERFLFRKKKNLLKPVFCIFYILDVIIGLWVRDAEPLVFEQTHGVHVYSDQCTRISVQKYFFAKEKDVWKLLIKER